LIMTSSAIVGKLMTVDKIGLFWVIIKILLSSGLTGKSEDEIEKLLGIDISDDVQKTMMSYLNFYAKNNRSIDFFTEPLVKNSNIDDGDILFKGFIKKLLEFIQFGPDVYQQVEMDTLLKHPFLFLTRFEEKVKLFMEMENKTEEAYDSIHDSANKFLTTTNREKSQYQSDREKVVKMVRAAYDEYEKSQEEEARKEEAWLGESIKGETYEAGGNKKNRASSGNRTKKRNKRNKQNRRNRTKKRNKRNKQNRRNRTKKTKSRTRLVRRYK